jgi:hypothetical protein
VLVLALTLMTAIGIAQSNRPQVWPAGATTLRFIPTGAYNWRGAATHALTTTIWYPAVSTTRTVDQYIGPSDSPLFILGR